MYIGNINSKAEINKAITAYPYVYREHGHSIATDEPTERLIPMYIGNMPRAGRFISAISGLSLCI